MDLSTLIDAATHEFKQKIIACGDKLDGEHLTPALAEEMTHGIKDALAAAGVAALRTFLEGYEVDTDTLMIEDTLYRYKQPSRKLFLTPFGPMWLTRNLYQADRGGPSYVPLDRYWGMVGQFAALEVREAVLFAGASACVRLGRVQAAQGDYPGARQELEAALQLHEEMAHPGATASVCNQLGAVLLADGDGAGAAALHQRALKLSREQGDAAGEGFAQVGLGNIAAQQGEIPQAIGLFTMAAEQFRRRGMPEQARQTEQALRSLWGRRG